MKTQLISLLWLVTGLASAADELSHVQTFFAQHGKQCTLDQDVKYTDSHRFVCQFGEWTLDAANPLPDAQDAELAFNTRLIYTTNTCDRYSLGNTYYLKNDNSSNSYQVTVEISWRKGLDSGSYQRMISVAPGGQSYVGCNKRTQPGAYTTYYYYRIVGEQ